MSPPTDIVRVIRAVARGSEVDWAGLRSGALDESMRAIVQELEVVARIAKVHGTDQTVRSEPPVELLDGGPTVWGPLTVMEHVGSGTFGDVYRAWDPRLDREVALKVLRRASPDPGSTGAVVEEGRLLARVRHPNVVTVYGADRVDGQVGIWMQFVEGRTLEELLREHGPLDSIEATRIGIEVCRAMGAVHRAGLLHGDIKAQNVMREDDGRIVLMDFGAGRDDRHASADTLAGTALYLAPEIIGGQPATRQSEIYSVGVLLYHLVTGGYPIAAATLADVKTAHANQAYIPLRNLLEAIPGLFVEAVDLALSRDPGRRFSSAADMEKALQSIGPLLENVVAGPDSYQSFPTGFRLGSYEVLRTSATAARCTVYEAKDRTSSRKVSLWVLNQEIASDRHRQRLLKQAHAVAHLEHPNIRRLYEVGNAQGFDFLAIEHLGDATLLMKMHDGGLSLDQSLTVAIEVAEALAGLHKLGIAHGDLEPSCLTMTSSGVKLALSVNDLSPGVRERSPEELRGEEPDARSDIYALGVMIRQMTAAGSLDRIVRRCLATDPDDRWQSATDVAFVLRDHRDSTAAASEADAGPNGRVAFTMRSVLAVVALLAISLILVPFAIGARSSTKPSVSSSVRLLLSEEVSVSSEDFERPFAVSPDGTRVVYVGESGGVRRLHLRQMTTGQAMPIAGTEGAEAPFFSPDGERVGFIAGTQLKTIALGGGAPVVVAEMQISRGAAWSWDDTIIFSPATDGGLWQVPATGGTPRVLAEPDFTKGERSYRWPTILPGGDAVIFTVATSDILSFDDARLAVRSLRTGEQHEVVRGGTFAACVRGDELVYARAGTLFSVPFDPKRLRVNGVARPVLNGVVTHPADGSAQYALASNGTLLYITGKSEERDALPTWVDRQGHSTRIAIAPAAFQDLSISPDGTRAALKIDGANGSIWILDLERNSLTRLTSAWSNNDPVWTSDGSSVAFSSARQGIRTLYSQRVDGQGSAEAILPSKLPFARVFRSSWSPDGEVVAFFTAAEGTGNDLWITGLHGDRMPRPLLQTAFNEWDPVFAPNNRWLAYVSDETGAAEVYVKPYGSSGRTWRVSTQGGTRPVWSRDGHELFYRNGDAMMTVGVDPSGLLSPRPPRVLFRKSSPFPFDVAPDGRFLMIEDLHSQTAARPVTVVLNWNRESI